MKCLQSACHCYWFSWFPLWRRNRGAFPSGRIVDLTYAFDANSVYWPTRRTVQTRN